MSLLPYQQRIVEESQQLVARIEKLQAFTDTPTFKSLDAAERLRLARQLNHMGDYAGVLGERINAWEWSAEKA